MLINVSAIPYAQWDPLQRRAALRDYGMICDLQFPEVASESTEADVEALAQETVAKALKLAPQDGVFMVKGELSLTIAMIDILRDAGRTVLIPASDRWVDEVRHGKKTQTRTRHRFVRFREV